jgi:hypothetical protein
MNQKPGSAGLYMRGGFQMEVAPSLISAVSGLAGVFLGGWLTFRNAGKEKMIDLRRSCYGAIRFDLSEAEKVMDVANVYISEGGWDRYFDSDEQKKHSEQISVHIRSIEKRLSEDYLTISDDFRSLYYAFCKDSAAADEVPY